MALVHIEISPHDLNIRTLANSEDADEILILMISSGPVLFVKAKRYSKKGVQYYFVNITCDPLIYRMYHPKIIVSNQKEKAHQNAKS